MNDLFLRACKRQATSRPPIWIMRQAGRYLPEYRAVREKAGSFLDLCHNPEWAAEVTRQPVDILGVDAAILFTDILVIPDAMGMDLAFSEGRGPSFGDPIRSAADIDRLGKPDPEQDLSYVMETIRLLKPTLNVPLIGFCGSPWTLAAYMIEGHGSRDFNRAKGMLHAEPDLLEKLLNKLVVALVDYLKAQVANGADVLQIFDTWGGLLAPEDLKRFSLDPIHRVIEGLGPDRPPVIVFSKGSHGSLEMIADTGCDVVGLDWTIPINQAKARVGDRVALQGNLDPCVLYAPPAVIQAKAHGVMRAFGDGPGHIFNLGHGIFPDVPVAHAKALVDAVKAVREPVTAP